jgi:hypothetical protein
MADDCNITGKEWEEWEEDRCQETGIQKMEKLMLCVFAGSIILFPHSSLLTPHSSLLTPNS